MGLLSNTIGNVDAEGEQILNGVDDANVRKQVHGKIRRDLYQNIDVAIRPVVTARPRAEQGGMSHTARPQGGLVLFQPVNDVLSIHDGHIPSYHRTAVITRASFANSSSISASSMIKGGVSAIVSPVTRMTMPSSWNALSIAA
jgi:hypothetical protein